MIAISLFLLASFLIGSVPFGFLLSRKKAAKDGRKCGSGNMDAADAARIAGKGLGFLTMVLDGFKGFFPVIVAVYLGNRMTGVLIDDLTILASFAALCAVLGHAFTPWLGFKGGKGVATAIGAALVFSPLSALLAIGVLVITTAITRYVSLGGILGVLTLALYFLHRLITIHRFDMPYIAAVWTFIALLVIARHHENIKRIINRTEDRLFSSRSS